MKRILAFTCLGAIYFGTPFAYAAGEPTNSDQGSGKVEFVGQVIDSPCSVQANDGKPVDLGSVSIASLKNNKKLAPTPFNINLRDCDISANGKTVSVTFTGSGAYTPTGSSPNILGITGSAENVGIILVNGDNQRITLGQPVAVRKIMAGNQDMPFGAYIVPTIPGDKDNPGQDPVAGNFVSTANFTLTYQ